MIILQTYLLIACLFWFISAVAAINERTPNEIDSLFDWIFYGLFWIVIGYKYLIKFFIKLFNT